MPISPSCFSAASRFTPPEPSPTSMIRTPASASASLRSAGASGPVTIATGTSRAVATSFEPSGSRARRVEDDAERRALLEARRAAP